MEFRCLWRVFDCLFLECPRICLDSHAKAKQRGRGKRAPRHRGQEVCTSQGFPSKTFLRCKLLCLSNLTTNLVRMFSSSPIVFGKRGGGCSCEGCQRQGLVLQDKKSGVLWTNYCRTSAVVGTQQFPKQDLSREHILRATW